MVLHLNHTNSFESDPVDQLSFCLFDVICSEILVLIQFPFPLIYL
jgi:hypothetical protein